MDYSRTGVKMGWYDFQNLTNTSSLVEQLQYTNDTLTLGWYGTLVLIGFFLVLFLMFKDYETKERFAGAGFLTTLVAILLKILNLVSEYVILIFILVTVGGIISLLFTKDM